MMDEDMKKQQVKKGKSLEGGEEPQKERRKCRGQQETEKKAIILHH
jgi:hypothetical protein